ncbi:MAG: leucyl aminopeptidase, partial [Gammaproteobacteria bacterium]
MHFLVTSASALSTATDCLVLGVFEGKKLESVANAIDEATQGLIGKILKSGDISGAAGQTLMLNAPQGLACERLLLVGCGKKKALDARNFRKIAEAAAKALLATRATSALTTLLDLPVQERDHHWIARQLIETLGHASYRFNVLKTIDKDDKPPALKSVSFYLTDPAAEGPLKQVLAQAEAINHGIRLCKDLANLPGNICTPSYLADQAEQLAGQFKSIKTTILDEKEMEKLGMGALLSVSRGSRQPARLIVMEYKGPGSQKKKPVVLVGKGLTFDAGGISIKPAAGMDEMKYDMCGGASVFGTLRAIAEMKLPIHVVGVVPSSENLPDGAANKPADIVTTMSGQTVEILNTDAEGRLILCDALTYSKRFDPAEVIDIATLTGA